MANNYRKQEPEPAGPIQACQYEGSPESFIELMKFAPKVVLKRDREGTVRVIPDKLLEAAEPVELKPGDYLVKASETEVYACSPELFAQLCEQEPGEFDTGEASP